LQHAARNHSSLHTAVLLKQQQKRLLVFLSSSNAHDCVTAAILHSPLAALGSWIDVWKCVHGMILLANICLLVNTLLTQAICGLPLLPIPVHNLSTCLRIDQFDQMFTRR
jgi:hypothetical protein